MNLNPNSQANIIVVNQKQNLGPQRQISMKKKNVSYTL